MATETDDRFAPLTEVPGLGATDEQLRMLATRYRWAAGFAEDKDVLEVACGAGLGLPLLASVARSVTGVDVSSRMLHLAQANTQSTTRAVSLRWGRAEALPFTMVRFDLVLCFEAVYYFANHRTFLEEAHRVLRPGGALLLTFPNRQRRGFITSPHAVSYPTDVGLRVNAEAAGFVPELLLCGFPQHDGFGTFLREVLERYHIAPSTLQGRAVLKRAMHAGHLRRIPQAVTHDMPVEPLRPVDRFELRLADDYRCAVLYAVLRKP